MISIFVLALSYLLGSIPFGLLIGRWGAKVDVRLHGSGNIGMTNVWRTAGGLCALMTLICDAGKGFLSVLLAEHFVGGTTFPLVAGIFAVIGHNWPVFLGFRGGKGVATIAGVLLAFRPLGAAILFVIWILVLLISRYISLASLVVAACLPLVLGLLRSAWVEVALAVIVAIVTIYRHRSNIERLRNGTEFRFGQKVNS
ncbi:MAG: glycerol-3-phosphate 1-O-acyltransferase PlsY [Bacillota bacterium]|jgi:glycerol-3-phosphate acyltransferase PlsY|nr:glycerol-3-phosphate 1-O-acyltransferase PlsY [Bacillota bacterium]HHT91505.1 glycerol-3-phosphate 1-O-acyltransferase PlsY [Bacillota bacterium]